MDTEGIHLYRSRPHDEVMEMMSVADIFFYPTRFVETFCSSILEAQAHGCLCISSTVGEIPNTVGDRGYLFDIESWPDFVSKVLTLLYDYRSNPRKYDSVRIKAMNWAKNQTWDEKAKQWNDIFF